MVAFAYTYVSNFFTKESLLILGMAVVHLGVNLRRVIRAMRKGYVLVSCVLSVHFIMLAGSCVYEFLLKNYR